MDIKQPRYDDVFYEGVAQMDADARGDENMDEIKYINPPEVPRAVIEAIEFMDRILGGRFPLREETADPLSRNHNAPPMPEG